MSSCTWIRGCRTVDLKMSHVKQAVLGKLRHDHGNFAVLIDPNAMGVVVPPYLKRSSRIVLNWGLNVNPPIHDIMFTDEALSGTLAFGKDRFHCTIPWHAVLKVSDFIDRHVPKSLRPSFVVHTGVATSPPRGKLRLVS